MKKSISFLSICILFATFFFPASETTASKNNRINIDNSRNEMVNNKTIPLEFEIQVLTALSYYPEFKNLKIDFISKDIKTTMACQPNVTHILKTGQRAYFIFIDINSHNEGILLNEVPFNAQIGVIGHELAHIVDYESKSNSQLMQTGMGYLFNGYKRTLEHKVDKITIERGLGKNLMAWAKYSMYQSKASEEYKAFKKDIYLEPEEIEIVMQNK